MKLFLNFILLLLIGTSVISQPIRLLPENPHYYQYKGNPTILITSAEHYGAVVNCKFDYKSYLEWLASYGLNYTRIYPGYLIEPPDKWIKGNPLGLKPDEVIVPGKEVRSLVTPWEVINSTLISGTRTFLCVSGILSK